MEPQEIEGKCSFHVPKSYCVEASDWIVLIFLEIFWQSWIQPKHFLENHFVPYRFF